MALELASVSSMIGEILIKIGLKMTIFIHEFFGISLDASTVSLYNRALRFLGQFRIFENRPLDPVFYFLSKCESKLVKKQKTEKLSREIKTQ